jgi:mannosyltransferase OCH1-like enzyme
MIPTDIYQTWKTRTLPQSITHIREKLQQLNPTYTMHLFDDTAMDAWMHEHTDEQVFQAYSKLAVGAARADLWRYCILYRNGGVYLDIDSDILQPLDTFISPTDQAVISRELNRGCFLQWCMAFVPRHPILKRAIEIATKNIMNPTSTNVAEITGPHAFSRAVNEVMLEYYPMYCNLYYQPDEVLNSELNTSTEVRCKFIGIDFTDAIYGTLAVWKSNGASDLYTPDTPHWLDVRSPFV